MEIFDRIKEYAFLQPSRWHTPGHKGRLPFDVSALDITELDLKQKNDLLNAVSSAERRAAAYFKARKTRFLVNGASSGIHAALMCLDRGDKVLIERNSHKSVYNGCVLAGLEPIIVENAVVEDIAQPLSLRVIRKAIELHPEVRAVVVTSPNYFGQVADVENIKAAIGNRLLIVDEAHGAHFAASSLFPISAASIADICIDSGHKTMPVFTQGAYISVNNAQIEGRLLERLDMLTTTSPSYLILGSLECGVELMGASGTRLEELWQRVHELRAEIPCAANHDFLRIVFDAAACGVSGFAVQRFLRESYALYAEFATSRYVVFIASVMDAAEDIDILKGALQAVVRGVPLPAYKSEPPRVKPLVRASFLAASRAKAEYISLEQSAGRVAACEAGLFPPCVPLVVRGEEITPAVAKKLAAGNVFGVSHGTIKVLKK